MNIVKVRIIDMCTVRIEVIFGVDDDNDSILLLCENKF